VLYLLSTSIGEILVIGGAIVIGLPLPLLPAQIIWLNFVTDGFFTIALAMEPRENGLLNTFERSRRSLVDALMSIRMTLMALVMMVVTLFLFQSYYEVDLAKTWTISLTILAVFQWFNAWNCRSEKNSVFSSSPFENTYMIGATVLAFLFQLLAVYHPLFQKFLRTVPLEFGDWLVIIALATSIFVVEEARKFLARRTLPKALTLKPVLEP
jgi:Ca2+-transporting ATPase